MKMLFLISNSTQRLSLSWGNMVSAIHGYPPTVSLVPLTILGVPTWDASSCWAPKSYATNLAPFSLKNKALLSPNFPLSILRNENGLENSSLGLFRLVWVVQVGKNVLFPKLTNSPSLSSESNSQTSESCVQAVQFLHLSTEWIALLFVCHRHTSSFEWMRRMESE